MDFILAASRLYAQTYNLNVNVDNATACQILLNLHLTPFQPHDGVHIPFTDQEMQKSRSTIGESYRRPAIGQRYQPCQSDGRVLPVPVKSCEWMLARQDGITGP